MNIIIDDQNPEYGSDTPMKSGEAYDYFTTLGKHPRDFKFRKVPLKKQPNGTLVTDANHWRNSKFLLTAVHRCEQKYPGLLGLNKNDKELYRTWFGLQEQNQQAAYTFVWLYDKLMKLYRAWKGEPKWEECLHEAVRHIYGNWQIGLSEDEDEELERAKAEARVGGND